MSKSRAGLSSSVLFGIFLGLVFSARPSFAQSDDPGLLRSLNTDSAQIETTYYLEATFDNNTAPYHPIYLYGEALIALKKDLGLELDFPSLYTVDRLGEYPAALEPIGLFARYEFYHFGGWNDETAGALSIEAGGSYGFHNPGFPWIGSSWSVGALGGYRVGRFFLQGDYTYLGGIDPKVPDQWRLDTDLGYRLTNEWFLQVEADFSAFQGSFNISSWSCVPQVAFQPGDWLFEFGESFGVNTPSGVTELMVARAL